MSAPEHSAEIADAVQALDREWRRMRLSRTDRDELAAEVFADLEAAAVDGVGPAHLLGPDPAGFAREAADSRGFVPKPGAYGRTLVGGVAGLLVIAVIAYPVTQLLYAALTAAVDLPFRWGFAGAFLGVGTIAVVALLGTLAGVSAALRGRWAARTTVTRAGLLLPLTVGAAGGVATAYAQHRNVSTDDQTVLTEIVIVVAGWVVALIAARCWALRSTPQASLDEQALTSH